MAATKKQVKVKVRLDREGVRACGEYKAGTIYTVTEIESKRLIEVKGFTLIEDES
jgi:hypothetical protein